MLPAVKYSDSTDSCRTRMADCLGLRIFFVFVFVCLFFVFFLRKLSITFSEILAYQLFSPITKANLFNKEF